MQIKINGKERTISDSATVTAMLKELNINNPMIIIELNRNVIKKNEYNNTILSPNDTVEIITLMGGG